MTPFEHGGSHTVSIRHTRLFLNRRPFLRPARRAMTTRPPDSAGPTVDLTLLASLAPAERLDALRSSPAGLTSADAVLRLERLSQEIPGVAVEATRVGGGDPGIQLPGRRQ